MATTIYPSTNLAPKTAQLSKTNTSNTSNTSNTNDSKEKILQNLAPVIGDYLTSSDLVSIGASSRALRDWFKYPLQQRKNEYLGKIKRYNERTQAENAQRKLEQTTPTGDNNQLLNHLKSHPEELDNVTQLSLCGRLPRDDSEQIKTLSYLFQNAPKLKTLEYSPQELLPNTEKYINHEKPLSIKLIAQTPDMLSSQVAEAFLCYQKAGDALKPKFDVAHQEINSCRNWLKNSKMILVNIAPNLAMASLFRPKTSTHTLITQSIFLCFSLVMAGILVAEHYYDNYANDMLKSKLGEALTPLLTAKQTYENRLADTRTKTDMRSRQIEQQQHALTTNQRNQFQQMDLLSNKLQGDTPENPPRKTQAGTIIPPLLTSLNQAHAALSSQLRDQAYLHTHNTKSDRYNQKNKALRQVETFTLKKQLETLEKSINTCITKMADTAEAINDNIQRSALLTEEKSTLYSPNTHPVFKI